MFHQQTQAAQELLAMDSLNSQDELDVQSRMYKTKIQAWNKQEYPFQEDYKLNNLKNKIPDKKDCELFSLKDLHHSKPDSKNLTALIRKPPPKSKHSTKPIGDYHTNSNINESNIKKIVSAQTNENEPTLKIKPISNYKAKKDSPLDKVLCIKDPSLLPKIICDKNEFRAAGRNTDNNNEPTHQQKTANSVQNNQQQKVLTTNSSKYIAAQSQPKTTAYAHQQLHNKLISQKNINTNRSQLVVFSSGGVITTPKNYELNKNFSEKKKKSSHLRHVSEGYFLQPKLKARDIEDPHFQHDEFINQNENKPQSERFESFTNNYIQPGPTTTTQIPSNAFNKIKSQNFMYGESQQQQTHEVTIENRTPRKNNSTSNINKEWFAKMNKAMKKPNENLSKAKMEKSFNEESVITKIHTHPTNEESVIRQNTTHINNFRKSKINGTIETREDKDLHHNQIRTNTSWNNVSENPQVPHKVHKKTKSNIKAQDELESTENINIVENSNSDKKLNIQIFRGLSGSKTTKNKNDRNLYKYQQFDNAVDMYINEGPGYWEGKQLATKDKLVNDLMIDSNQCFEKSSPVKRPTSGKEKLPFKKPEIEKIKKKLVNGKLEVISLKDQIENNKQFKKVEDKKKLQKRKIVGASQSDFIKVECASTNTNRDDTFADGGLTRDQEADPIGSLQKELKKSGTNQSGVLDGNINKAIKTLFKNEIKKNSEILKKFDKGKGTPVVFLKRYNDISGGNDLIVEQDDSMRKSRNSKLMVYTNPTLTYNDQLDTIKKAHGEGFLYKSGAGAIKGQQVRPRENSTRSINKDSQNCFSKNIVYFKRSSQNVSPQQINPSDQKPFMLSAGCTNTLLYDDKGKDLMVNGLNTLTHCLYTNHRKTESLGNMVVGNGEVGNNGYGGEGDENRLNIVVVKGLKNPIGDGSDKVQGMKKLSFGPNRADGLANESQKIVVSIQRNMI